jgi:hypothetical protein
MSIEPQHLLHYTLTQTFPELLPYLGMFNDTQLLKFSRNYLESITEDKRLIDAYHTFYESVEILREIDERMDNLLNLKRESNRYRSVLRDLQSRLSNES